MKRNEGYWKIDYGLLKHELGRKGLHLLIAFLPIIVVYSRLLALGLLLLGTIVYTISEYIRVQHIDSDRGAWKIFYWISCVTEFSSRGREKDSFMIAPLTLAAGAGLTVMIFEMKPLTVGIFALAFGDTAAALAGQIFPIHRLPGINGKSYGGLLSCFLASMTAAYFLVGDWPTALILGIITAMIEAIPLGAYDNLCIPICVAFAAQMIL